VASTSEREHPGDRATQRAPAHAATGTGSDQYVEIDHEGTHWRFERAFLTSNWRCLFGDGCRGILDRPAEELGQGCCSLGAHFGEGPAGEAEAMAISALAAMIPDDRFQFRSAVEDHTGLGVFGDRERTHTRVVEGACIFLNRPGFAGGAGCALHLAALAAGESPTEWKPSVCWQLPLRIDWEAIDETTESATVRRWTRRDWGEHGQTMAWCCTEIADGGEAYRGGDPVVVTQRDELVALAGETVYVELRRRLDDNSEPASAPVCSP
jgi:hypothetical protein